MVASWRMGGTVQSAIGKHSASDLFELTPLWDKKQQYRYRPRDQLVVDSIWIGRDTTTSMSVGRVSLVVMCGSQLEHAPLLFITVLSGILR